MMSKSFASPQALAARPTVRRPKRAAVVRAALPQRQVDAQPLKAGAAGLAAALLLVRPAGRRWIAACLLGSYRPDASNRTELFCRRSRLPLAR